MRRNPNRIPALLIGLFVFLLSSSAGAAVSPDSARLSREFCGFGSDELKAGQVIRSLVSFNEALGLNPELVDAWVGRSHAAAQLGHLDDALDASAHALALDPANKEAWTLQAGILFNMKRYDAALVAFDKGIALGSDNTDTWNKKGQTLDSLGRHEEAQTAYQTARSKTVVVPVVPYKGGLTRMTHTRIAEPQQPAREVEPDDTTGQSREQNR